MSKINRPNKNILSFASKSAPSERTIYKSDNVSDSLEDNLNADYERGFGLYNPLEVPRVKDFNGFAFTLSKLYSYLFQAGISEYNQNQEYHLNSITNVGGTLYKSIVDNNVGNIPIDVTNTETQPTERRFIQNKIFNDNITSDDYFEEVSLNYFVRINTSTKLAYLYKTNDSGDINIVNPQGQLIDFRFEGKISITSFDQYKFIILSAGLGPLDREAIIYTFSVNPVDGLFENISQDLRSPVGFSSFDGEVYTALVTNEFNLGSTGQDKVVTFYANFDTNIPRLGYLNYRLENQGKYTWFSNFTDEEDVSFTYPSGTSSVASVGDNRLIIANKANNKVQIAQYSSNTTLELLFEYDFIDFEDGIEYVFPGKDGQFFIYNGSYARVINALSNGNVLSISEEINAFGRFDLMMFDRDRLSVSSDANNAIYTYITEQVLVGLSPFNNYLLTESDKVDIGSGIDTLIYLDDNNFIRLQYISNAQEDRLYSIQIDQNGNIDQSDQLVLNRSSMHQIHGFKIDSDTFCVCGESYIKIFNYDRLNRQINELTEIFDFKLNAQTSYCCLGHPNINNGNIRIVRCVVVEEPGVSTIDVFEYDGTSIFYAYSVGSYSATGLEDKLTFTILDSGSQDFDMYAFLESRNNNFRIDIYDNSGNVIFLNSYSQNFTTEGYKIIQRAYNSQNTFLLCTSIGGFTTQNGYRLVSGRPAVYNNFTNTLDIYGEENAIAENDGISTRMGSIILINPDVAYTFDTNLFLSRYENLPSGTTVDPTPPSEDPFWRALNAEDIGFNNFGIGIQSNTLRGAVEGILTDIRYPVGSLYMNTTAFSPSSKLGFGTWELIEGKMIAGVSDTDPDFLEGVSGGFRAYQTDGHSLTIDQIPDHNHQLLLEFQDNNGASEGSAYVPFREVNQGKFDGSDIRTTEVVGAGDAHTHNLPDLPPFYTIYIWKRIL